MSAAFTLSLAVAAFAVLDAPAGAVVENSSAHHTKKAKSTCAAFKAGKKKSGYATTFTC